MHSAYVTKNSPKNFVLSHDTDYALKALLKLQNQKLNGKYECFLIRDIALNNAYFGVCNNALRFEIGESIRGLEQGGFNILWRQQYKYNIRMSAMKWPQLRVASPYISINTLLPFFYTVGITMILFGVVLIAEAKLDVRAIARLVKRFWHLI